MDTQHEPIPTRIPVAGRSLHRWLVGIPVILYVATVGFFALYAIAPDSMWVRDAILSNLAAVLAAAIVAVPGLIDLLAIPSGHPARPVALGHMSTMVVVLALFVTNLVLSSHVLTAALAGTLQHDKIYDVMMPLMITGTALVLAVAGGAGGFFLAIRYRVGEASPTPTAGSMTPRPH